MTKKLKLTSILERRKKDWTDMGPPGGPDPRFDDEMSKHMGFRNAMNPPTPHGKLRSVVGHPDFSDEDDFGMAEEELEIEDPDLEEADKYPSSVVKKYPQGYDPSGKLVKEKTKYPTSGEQYPGKLKKINEKSKYPAKGKMYPEKAEMKLESLFKESDDEVVQRLKALWQQQQQQRNKTNMDDDDDDEDDISDMFLDWSLEGELARALRSGDYQKYMDRARNEKIIFVHGQKTGWDPESLLQLVKSLVGENTWSPQYWEERLRNYHNPKFMEERVKKPAAAYAKFYDKVQELEAKKRGKMKLESLFKEGPQEFVQRYGTHSLEVVLRALDFSLDELKNGGNPINRLEAIKKALKEMSATLRESKQFNLTSILEDFGGEETEKNVPNMSQDGDLQKLIQKTQLAGQHAQRLISQGQEKEAKALLGRLHQLLMSKLG